MTYVSCAAVAGLTTLARVDLRAAPVAFAATAAGLTASASAAPQDSANEKWSVVKKKYSTLRYSKLNRLLV